MKASEMALETEKKTALEREMEIAVARVDL